MLASQTQRRQLRWQVHRNLLTKAVAELHAALAKFSTLIAFQTNATKCILIAALLTEERWKLAIQKRKN